MRKRQKDKLIAYHEAGHAVADLREGNLVLYASIVPDHGKSEAGRCSADGESIISLLAGYAAAVEYRRRHGLPSGRRQRMYEARGARSDFAKVRAVLGERGNRTRTLKPWLEKARQFVQGEWPAIRAVAQELLRAKALDDIEIEMVVEAGDQARDPESASAALAEAAVLLEGGLPPEAAVNPALFLRRVYLSRLEAGRRSAATPGWPM